MSDPLISLESVSAGYHGQPVIHDIDLHVDSGSMHALFGANGSGKTTTLLTVAGVVRVQSGKILLAGKTHPGSLYLSARRQRLALLTDDRGIFPPLTVRENLKLGRGSVGAALEYFPELTDHVDRPAGQLSGGQQQMLSLARILASEPSIILADELSLGLAPLIVRRLMVALRAAADQGAAVLLVEQHVPIALQSVDSASVLSRGRITLRGDAEEFRSDPTKILDQYLTAA